MRRENRESGVDGCKETCSISGAILEQHGDTIESGQILAEENAPIGHIHTIKRSDNVLDLCTIIAGVTGGKLLPKRVGGVYSGIWKLKVDDVGHGIGDEQIPQTSLRVSWGERGIVARGAVGGL